MSAEDEKGQGFVVKADFLRGEKLWICTADPVVGLIRSIACLSSVPTKLGGEVTNNPYDEAQGPGWRSASFDPAEDRRHDIRAIVTPVTEKPC